MKIRTKIILAFSIVIVITNIMGAYGYYLSSTEIILEDSMNHLETAGKSKAHWINSYFTERKEDIHILSEMQIVKESISLENKTIPFLADYKEHYGYYDLFLISPTGEIFYTVEHESDYETNLETGPYKDTSLAKVYRNAKSKEHAEVSISDFEYYEPSKEPAAFLAAPVYKNNVLIGIAAAQISTDQINSIMQDRTGLGETGETYLVGPDLLMRSDSRFFEESTILKQKVDTENARNCLMMWDNPEGHEKHKETTIFPDYRGVSVLGTHVYIPELNWCLLAEIDEAEALGVHKNEIIKFSLFITSIMVGVAILIGFFMAEKISNPIRELTKDAEKIGKGDLDHKIDVKVRDEIGELAVAFDEMRKKRKQAEEALLASNKELEAFSYSVSHDLRAPLRTINGFSNAVLEDYASKLDSNGQRYLRLIEENANVMGHLIDDILAFSRLGRQELTLSNIAMEQLAKTTFEEIKSGFPDRKLQLKVGKLPPAKGDQSMIRQVFVNLIDNAIKFTAPKDKAVVEVDGKVEGNENVYYVKDNGVGFDMKYVDKLFGVFQRLHSREEFEGTGIGLAIVKRIINRHDGMVWAKGEINKGATFYFTLSNIKKEVII